MGARVPLTKLDAVAAVQAIARKGEAERNVGGAIVDFRSEKLPNQTDKWIKLTWHAQGGLFSIYKTHVKHLDGRIRQAYSEVEGATAFARWLLDHHPDVGVYYVRDDLL